VVTRDEATRVTVGLAPLGLGFVAYVAIGLVWRPSDEAAALVIGAQLTVAAAWVPWFLSQATVRRWLPCAACVGAIVALFAATFFSFPPPPDLTLVAAVEDTRTVLREGTSADVIEPVEASLEIVFDGCLKDPKVTLRLTRNGKPVRFQRLVVVDEDGNQVIIDEDGDRRARKLGQLLAPRHRRPLQSCYLPLPRLLGASRQMARARTLAGQSDPDRPPLVGVDVSSATTSVGIRDAQLTMVSGPLPTRRAPPAAGNATPRGPEPSMGARSDAKAYSRSIKPIFGSSRTWWCWWVRIRRERYQDASVAAARARQSPLAR
jgi:hypothetical protein